MFTQPGETVAAVGTVENVSRGTWGIQIGAYSDSELGRRSLARVVGSLPTYLSHADAVDAAGIDGY